MKPEWGEFKRKKNKNKKDCAQIHKKGSIPRKLGGWDECPKKATGGVEGR